MIVLDKPVQDILGFPTEMVSMVGDIIDITRVRVDVQVRTTPYRRLGVTILNQDWTPCYFEPKTRRNLILLALREAWPLERAVECQENCIIVTPADDFRPHRLVSEALKDQSPVVERGMAPQRGTLTPGFLPVSTNFIASLKLSIHFAEFGNGGFSGMTTTLLGEGISPSLDAGLLLTEGLLLQELTQTIEKYGFTVGALASSPALRLASSPALRLASKFSAEKLAGFEDDATVFAAAPHHIPTVTLLSEEDLARIYTEGQTRSYGLTGADTSDNVYQAHIAGLKAVIAAALGSVKKG